MSVNLYFYGEYTYAHLYSCKHIHVKYKLRDSKGPFPQVCNYWWRGCVREVDLRQQSDPSSGLKLLGVGEVGGVQENVSYRPCITGTS